MFERKLLERDHLYQNRINIVTKQRLILRNFVISVAFRMEEKA